jgi:DNA-binding NtrC family response regulator
MSLTNDDSGNPERVYEGSVVTDHGEQNSPLVIVAIDDDPGILGLYRAVMSGMGVRFESSIDPRQALDLVATHDPSLVILDLTMPGIDGMELLHRIKSRDPQTRVVMITGNYTIDTAVKAIQEGAIDYVCKPVTAEKLRELVTRVRSLVTQEERTRALERELADVSNLEGIIGHSPRMLEVFDLIRRVAPHFHTALITGEPGSEKEIVARALHNLSSGKNQRFTVFKCGALAADVVDNQLSGHRGEAFAGAVDDEARLSEWASGGTVFLNEVGDLNAAAQSKLLQVFEKGEAQELGLPQTQQVNVQVIASTSRDLQVETQSGRFRPDLWYRLSTVQIHLPALRERMDDILLLARHFLARFSPQYGKDVRRMSRGAEAALLAYSWPGNVHELENIIGRACMLTTSHILDCGDLPAEVVLPGYTDDDAWHRGMRGPAPGSAQRPASPTTLRQKIREILVH